MTAPLAAVAGAVRHRLPGLPDDHMHKLLYWCQGHSLALTGEPMIVARLVACVDGPIVDAAIPASSPHRLGRVHANTVLYVVGRYGGLAIRDMSALTRTEDPWALTPLGAEIGHDLLQDWFTGPGRPDYVGDPRLREQLAGVPA
jgi:uncharacterized phage-associated protein